MQEWVVLQRGEIHITGQEKRIMYLITLHFIVVCFVFDIVKTNSGSQSFVRQNVPSSFEMKQTVSGL